MLYEIQYFPSEGGAQWTSLCATTSYAVARAIKAEIEGRYKAKVCIVEHPVIDWVGDALAMAEDRGPNSGWFEKLIPRE